MGVAHTATLSTGEFLDTPELLSKGEQRRKRRLQRKLARQVKGSNRRNQPKLAIAKLSAKESDRRKDWIEKTTTELVRNYDLIVLEDLKVKNMTRSAKGTVESPGKNVAQKSGLNRSILEQSWTMFCQRLSDKAANTTEQVEVIFVNPAYTSMRCSKCAHTEPKSRKSQATFLCLACGHMDNADVNAAKNIIAAGLGVYGRQGTIARCAYQGKAQRPSEAHHQSSSCVSNLGSPVRKVGEEHLAEGSAHGFARLGARDRGHRHDPAR